MNILAIDTSAQVASVCVLDETVVLSEFSVNNKLTHSQTLMPMVESALCCAKLSLNDIDAFAVSSRPGVVYRLRIGVSAIKGLAYATGRALRPPSPPWRRLRTMATRMALSAPRWTRAAGSLTPYSDRCRTLSRLCADRAISIKSWADLLKFDENIFLVGDGADLCYNGLGSETRLSGGFQSI